MEDMCRSRDGKNRTRKRRYEGAKKKLEVESLQGAEGKAVR